ncbi:DUF6159 family protein [Calditrichota bacterium]
MRWFFNTFGLISASWDVLKQDKELMWFPVISGTCCLMLMATSFLPIFGEMPLILHTFGFGGPGLLIVSLIFLYFINYFIIIFSNVAIVHCAIMRIEGKNPTLADGLDAAFSRFEIIIGWTLIVGSVGLILRMMRKQGGLVNVIGAIAGVAWSLASYLVIPIIVVEKKWPEEALKTSANLLRKTWGSQIYANFSFGLVYIFALLPAYFIFRIAASEFSGAGLMTTLILLALYILPVSIVYSTLLSVFQAALYKFAKDRMWGRDFSGFNEDVLQNAIYSR